MKDHNIVVRNNLRRVLKEKAISHYKLARELEVDPSNLSRIINGKVLPRIDFALLIAQTLGVPLATLFFVDSQNVVQQ